MPKAIRISRKSAILFCLSIIFAAGLATLYLQSERTFYFWDYASYADKAFNTSSLFVQNPLAALRSVYFSTGLEYNDYFALPLIPLILLFKYSRLGYILGLALVYYIPLVIIYGKIAREIFPAVPNIGWITLFIGLAIPSLWASALRGFPDLGASLLIAIAVLIYLQDLELKQWLKHGLLIGFFCALAMVFRRHFAYSSVALFFCVGTTSFLGAISTGKWKGGAILAALRSVITQLGAALVAFVLTVSLAAPSLLGRLTGTNYVTLYQSYALAPPQVSAFFVGAYGILWVLAIGGLIGGLYEYRARADHARIGVAQLSFIVLFGFVSFILWILMPRQASVQYTLHLAPLIILGLAALTAWIISRLRSKTRVIALTGLAFVLVGNLWVGLAPASLVPMQTTINYPPLYRADYDEVVRLTAYLRRITAGGKKIYVVDSSQLMNRDLLYQAERAIYGGDTRLNILYSPDIDSRDFYPLEPLLQADTILITTPFQHNLPEEQQKVAKFVFDIFAQESEMSHDFQKTPEEFRLADGNVISVYERQSATSFADILSTFDCMKKDIPATPGSQPDWISIYPTTGEIATYPLSRHEQVLDLRDSSPGASFLYVDSHASVRRVLISGEAEFSDEECAPMKVVLQVFPFSDPTSMLSARLLTLAGTGKFRLMMESPNPSSAVVLRFEQEQSASTSDCAVHLDWATTPLPEP